MDIVAVWLIDIAFFSTGLWYVLYASHMLISLYRVLVCLLVSLFVDTFIS